MDSVEFRQQLKQKLPVGRRLPNPGGGESVIVGHGPKNLRYRRKNSVISVSYQDLWETYRHFAGKEVTSRELRQFRPKVFDSQARPAGHSCNCTFLFMALREIGLADGLSGGGTPGNPFRCHFQPLPNE